ncbi:hypothetical protein ACFL40_06200, partial [candidate division KSB1 bacterium]
ESLSASKEGDYIVAKLKFVPVGSYLLILNNNAPFKDLPDKAGNMAKRIPLKSFAVERKDPNSITLDFCRYRKGNSSWSEVLPVIGVQEKLTLEKYEGPVTVEFVFNSDIEPGVCKAVIEDAEDYEITVNNEEIVYSGLPYYRDPSFHPVDITQNVRRGTNYIRLSRHFKAPNTETIDSDNLENFWGRELEQIYLIGDFAVKGSRIGQDFFELTRYRYKPDFVITGEKGSSRGDLIDDGYCFYNGTIILTAYAEIQDIDENDRYFVEIEEMNATFGKINVNNHFAGNIGWHPYRVDITNFIWAGENKIEISLTNSLRNLLGSLHFVPLKGVLGQYPLIPTPSRYEGDGQNWLEKRKNGTVKTWSDDYFFRPFGLEGKVSIVCEKFSIDGHK